MPNLRCDKKYVKGNKKELKRALEQCELYYLIDGTGGGAYNRMHCLHACITNYWSPRSVIRCPPSCSINSSAGTSYYSALISTCSLLRIICTHPYKKCLSLLTYSYNYDHLYYQKKSQMYKRITQVQILTIVKYVANKVNDSYIIF